MKNKFSRARIFDDGLIQTQDFSVSKIIKRPQTFYTQGIYLEENGKYLIESGGLYGDSVLVKQQLPDLKIVKKFNLPKNYFAEGVAKCRNFIYQLTWREGKILKYTLNMELLDKIDIDPTVISGWGLSSTNNPDELIASDGSQKIHFLDCNNNLKVKKSIEVKLNHKSIDLINALAFGKGEIWANRYFDNRILRIDPNTGNVIKTYDMSALVDNEIKNNFVKMNKFKTGDVLNGIAYNETTDKFILTGKRWGNYYETSFK
jgi:glutaminyl-peptide cyclotransferase